MFQKELEAAKNNPAFLPAYLEGMSNLFKSGVFNVLRAMARPNRHNFGADEKVMASEASYSAGFNDALDLLMNFKEFFIDPRPAQITPVMDFGGVEAALQRGDITKVEADAIRSNKSSVK